MNADPPPPPPWVWMVPGSPGCSGWAPGVAPPPVLLASAQAPAAPLLPGPPGWQAAGEPLLPLLPLPSAPDHAAAAVHHYPLLNGQWLFGGPSPSVGLSPSSTVELVPLFPHVCPSALPPPVGKSWIDKRIPNCKIIFNNAFALDSTWIYPEELRLFHGLEKPQLLANQVATSLSGPAPASRLRPAVRLAPRPAPGGCSRICDAAGWFRFFVLFADKWAEPQEEGLVWAGSGRPDSTSSRDRNPAIPLDPCCESCALYSALGFFAVPRLRIRGCFPKV
nr:transcription elongation regulator 1-like protein [Vicugna pacos]